jgi:tripartite-type tricarboxylate transporter receptor subunit TctC
LALHFAICVPAQAADYPVRPIRMVVGFAAGGATDIYARIVAQKMSDRFGQQVVVDNRAGAGGSLATHLVARATPDGYTLIFVSPSHAINTALYKSLPFDPVADFEPVSKVSNGSSYVVAVHPSLPAANLKEFIALAKAKPGAYNFASGGVGSTSHLAGELFKSRAGIPIVHVPYKGTGDALRDLLAGQVHSTVDALPALLPHIQRGALKALGVNIRTSLLPDVPSIAEAGLPDYEFFTWVGILAPAKTPQAIVNRLNAEINEILRLPDVQKRFADLSVRPAGSTPAEFRELLRRDIAKYGAIARSAGIQPQ